MADPLKIIRRLDAVTTDYAVFERDQVLTERQLNSVVEYLDDQSRLTRTQLLGVGIVGGLRPALGKGQISIGKGVGITSDGDLLGLPADTVFDRWLKYDESAPAYGPFYNGEKILPLVELLASDDRRDGAALAEIGDRLEKMVVIAFMESYENDPDLCTGGNCDNRGRTAHNTRRFLLIDREVVDKTGFAASLLTGRQVAGRMARLAAARPDLGSDAKGTVVVDSAEDFIKRYRDAAATSFKALMGAIKALNEAFGERWPEDLPNLAGTLAGLEKIVGSMKNVTAGIQYYHAFAKDLIATWGELRAAFYADQAVLCPAVDAFPKHLLLGLLGEPARLRTGCYPALWLVAGPGRERVLYLLRKFAALVDGCALPLRPTAKPKLVPSQREDQPLERRAIPIYYRADSAVRELWHEARWQLGDSEDNPGYHWTPPTAMTRELPDPFAQDVGGNAFFRIEGHIGMPVEAAEKAIESLMRQRNLPIAVLSVVLHKERVKVIRGPKFRKNSLHSLHYLLRQDLASHLKDNIGFSDKLVGSLQLNPAWIPKAESTAATTGPVDWVKAAKSNLVDAEKNLVGSGNKVLSARSFKSFNQVKGNDWSGNFNKVVQETAKLKSDLGNFMRTDVVSPVDAVSGSKSHLWVDWLGDIITKREDDRKDGLLFTKMIAAHPGLDHFGGAVPGGTFVLAYDDQGVVIGDLMLPYWIDDKDESDVEEPELKLPDIDFRIPEGLLPIKVIKPLQVDLSEFKDKYVLPEIKLQANYTQFFRESLGSLGDVLKNTRNVVAADLGAAKAATSDKYLDQMLRNIEAQQEQIKGLRDVAGDDRLTAATRDKAKEQIKQMEAQLAVSVGSTVEYFAVAAPENVRFEADKATVYQTVGSAINLVTDKEASARLQADLQKTNVAAGKLESGSSALVIGQVMSNAGFRVG